MEGFQTQEEIRGELEERHAIAVSRQTVSRDLAYIRGRLEQTAGTAYLQAVGTELARLDFLWRESLRGWRQSIGLHKKRHVKTVKPVLEVTDGKGKKAKVKTKATAGRSESSITEEQLNGDPRYLEVMLRSIERRCKILGLDKPLKIENPRAALAELLGIPEDEMPDTLEDLEELEDDGVVM